MASSYTAGSKVWLPNPEEVWESAVILEDYEDCQLWIEISSTKIKKKLEIRYSQDLPVLQDSSDDLVDEGVNLCELNRINEASVLNVLRKRFENFHIYNHCGASTMLILNPQIELPFVNKYHEVKNKFLEENSYESPLRQAAINCYRNLERKNYNQSIVFSGESGSGKTVYAESTIDYLLNYGTSKSMLARDRVSAALVVLRSFCTAKSQTNDDSSRFGKFIEFYYDKDYQLVGAQFKIYCFDANRVVFQVQEESNYEIFYQLRSKKDLAVFDEFPGEFRYLGKHSKKRDLTFSSLFQKTTEALTTLGFSLSQQTDVFNILRAILLLGNLEFIEVKNVLEKSRSNAYCFISNPVLFKVIAKLLSLDDEAANDILKWMCSKRKLSKDKNGWPMTKEESVRTRDNLAKFLYVKLFKSLISRINESFSSTSPDYRSISIIDFLGFERSNNNSFEKFCLNYALEKIQQLSIQMALKLKQQEYYKEEISWVTIGFADNQNCVNLFEKPSGIMDIINKESEILASLIKKSSSSSNVSNHISNLYKSSRESRNFTIHHFMGNVLYDVKNFFKNNIESVSAEQISVLRQTQNEFLKTMLFKKLSTQVPQKPKNDSTFTNSSQGEETVLTNLRNSMAALNSFLSKTNPYFVKCIKVNDKKRCLDFCSVRVVEQLRVFDIVNILKVQNFSDVSTYADFFLRYHFLNFSNGELKEACSQILNYYIKDDYSYHLGDTKVFLRTDAVTQLELLRKTKIYKILLPVKVEEYIFRDIFQDNFKKLSCYDRTKTDEQRLLSKIVTVQKCVRSFLAKKFFHKLLLREEADTLFEVLNTELTDKMLLLAKKINDHDRMYLQTGVNEIVAKNMSLKKRFTLLLQNLIDLRGIVTQVHTTMSDKSDDISLSEDEKKLVLISQVEKVNITEVLRDEIEVSSWKGMLRFDVQNINAIFDNLLTDVIILENIEKAPHVAAETLFMCIRYFDDQNDSLSARSLLEEYSERVKDAVGQNDQFLLMTYCLANTHSLLNFLKQFSKIGVSEKDYIKFNYANSSEQLEQCLRNLDLTFYWEVLESLGQWLVEQSVNYIIDRIYEFLVPTFFYRVGQSKIIDLKMEIRSCIDVFRTCKVENQVRLHILKEVFSFINSMVVANFMANLSEYCNKFHVQHVRDSFHHLLTWARENQMSQVIETLGSLRQIYRLVYIQPVARDDIEIIAKNYDKLSCKQIISILKSYKPLFNFEKPTSKITILKLELILAKKDYLNRKLTFGHDPEKEKFCSLQFFYSNIIFKDVQMPLHLNLALFERI